MRNQQVVTVSALTSDGWGVECRLMVDREKLAGEARKVAMTARGRRTFLSGAVSLELTPGSRDYVKKQRLTTPA